MTSTKLGLTINALKKSTGAVTASTSQAKTLIRRRNTRIRGTPAQIAQTANAWRNIGNLWNSGMSAAEQQAWTNFAIIFPAKDPFGADYQLTGWQAFAQANLPLTQRSITLLNVPPANRNVNFVTSFTATVTAAPQLIRVDSITATLVGGEYIDISASAILGAGQKRKKAHFGSLKHLAFPFATPIDFTAEYSSRRGKLIASFYVGISLKVVNSTNGAVSKEFLRYLRIM
jgi:hypothetical protein